MLSALTMRGARLAMQAIEKGAMDFVAKPKVASQIGEVAEELIEKVKAAARGRRLVADVEIAPPKNGHTSLKERGGAPVKLVAIGASSGGPHALRYLLPKLPADFPAGIVVVQHLPESFTGMFSKWLDELCKIKVREARDGSMATRGCALVAPGNAHLRVKRRSNGAEAKLDRGAPVNGHMPSVDVLFRSVAEEYGGETLAVIMTGMGGDGSEGIGQIQRAGGLTVAQDEQSCMIFGMPKVAIKKGFIDRVVPLEEMASYLIAAVGG
jgi:two-component system chemotaxis response regulator CheB